MRSMTGVASSTYKFDNIEISIEMRSVNARFFDFAIKSNYEFEPSLKLWFEKTAKKALLRGKARIYINIIFTEDEDNPYANGFQFNDDMLYYYDKIAKQLFNKKLHFSNLKRMSLSEVLLLPGILEKHENELSDGAKQEIKKLFSKTLDELLAYQKIEGEALKKAMVAYLENIESLLPMFEEKRQMADEAFIERLKERILELSNESHYDEARILQEIAIQAEKSTIEEELIRLKAHINTFRVLLTEKQPIGRKLDFLTQELNREVNTIGSKVKNLDLTAYVITAKENIENLREQLQNVV